MFKVFFLVLITLNLAHAGKKCKEVLEQEANKAHYEKLLSLYNHAVPVHPDFFSSKEQVWSGECITIFEWQKNKDIVRHEHYLVILRSKTMPGENSKARYASINYGGDPHSTGTPIRSAAQAIEWLGGFASRHISLAKISKKHASLHAKNYDKFSNLRHNMWGGRSTLFQTLLNSKGEIEEVCYFNEILVK